MLRNARQLGNFVVQATDGELGTLDQLYFDDETWAIRYLTVAMGWLGSRRVLISPISVTHVDWIDKMLDVALTKSQVENSPNIDTDKPVSRQHEIDFYRHYGVDANAIIDAAESLTSGAPVRHRKLAV